LPAGERRGIPLPLQSCGRGLADVATAVTLGSAIHGPGAQSLPARRCQALDKPMDQDDCDIPGHNHWEAALRARISGRAYLANSNLPATEQELLLDKALELLVRQFRRGRPVQFPEAWNRMILHHELGRRRKQGLCTNLDGDVVAEAATVLGLHDLLVDPWALVERHEGLFLGRLTSHEQLVYHAVRQGWSLKRCAQELQMSERDVRTRFGRICNPQRQATNMQHLALLL
jgi:hypothetical protein